MTSTHTASSTDALSTTDTPTDIPPTNTNAVADDDNDTSDASSFSDPYDEEDRPEQSNTAAAGAQAGGEVDDDYAMTFESDGEAGSNSPEDSNGAVDQHEVVHSAPAPLSGTETAPPSLDTIPSTTNTTTGPIDNSSLNHITSPPTTFSEPAPLAADGGSDPAMSETAQAPSQPPPAHSYESITKGEIDIQQLLDNITASAETNASSANGTPTATTVSSPTFPPGPPGPTGPSTLPSHSSLPPRPQVLQKPAMHPAYASQDDIRKYHAGPSFAVPPGSTAYRAPGMPMPIIAAGAPGTKTDARNILPPPPAASFNAPPSLPAPPSSTLPPHPKQDRPQNSVDAGDAEDAGEIQWGADIQNLYDKFLADERMYVSEGLWDRFPSGSRLFIGNLPTEKVTKRDIFYIFHKFGRLAQVSIKQAYGFVQFHDIKSCHAALQREQGQEIRGRKMHLEISKPQKNTRQAGSGQAQPATQRRSRSPDHARGGGSGRGGQGRNQPQAYDRYDGRALASPREGDHRGSAARGREDYRPLRSPSPQRGAFRGRDEYAQNRGRESYGGHDGRHTRSRSPVYDRRDGGRYRERSISPRRREMDEDAALGIPRRDARDVPEVQIILLEELDRNFISWVENDIRGRGLKTEVMFLSARLPVDVVIRRQIMEGVLAVVKLTHKSQQTSRIPLQVFDRTRGADNVRFDEYEDLEPRIAAELVIREKQKQLTTPAPAPVAYGQPAGQQYGAPAAQAAPNLGSIVGQLDNATLQKLLGTLNAPIQSPAPQQQQAPANGQVDLAGILGGLMGKSAQQPQQQQYPPQQQNQYSSQQAQYPPQGATPDLGALLGAAGLGQQSHMQGGQSAEDVQNIMAQLARFRQ
ncbi:nuclear polyadenylated RNA-binding protein 3 [Pseudogymnoascus australis]